MKLRACALALGLALPGLVQAGALDYTFLKADYFSTSPDARDFAADGIGLNLSYRLNEYLFLLAGQQEEETDELNGGVSGGYLKAPHCCAGTLKVEQLGFGLGARRAWNPTTDLVASAVRVRADVTGTQEFSGVEEAYTGVALQLGVRSLAVGGNLEVGAALSRLDLYHDASNGVNLDAVWLIVRNVGLTGAVAVDDDGEAFRVGLRVQLPGSCFSCAATAGSP